MSIEPECLSQKTVRMKSGLDFLVVFQIALYRLQSLNLKPEGEIIRKSMYDKNSGSVKITTHLEHISGCKTASGTNCSKIWNYRVFIINTHRDQTALLLRVVHLGRFNCHAISGRGDQTTDFGELIGRSSPPLYRAIMNTRRDQTRAFAVKVVPKRRPVFPFPDLICTTIFETMRFMAFTIF